jgi:glycosyltransferase involved in cell wall biosynthesis
VVGDAGLTVDPLDSAALCEALRRALFDRELRAELAVKGPARARRFTWTEAARKTADIYRWVGEETG